ncbi:thiamine pyrophosphate-dependent enzyme [Tundrisphaera lichenicola]|uniref:thiamine pyrophosphate-dependent enzyme n=1 Tax=Tundrisphaera lichenicola TaxID=2029860 RepID=UPI003EBCED3A
MPAKRLHGGEALARGALVAGVRTITSYPGSPSSEVVDVLIGLAESHDLQVEWSSNERVSMEIGIGVSIAGRRALVCTKSVGMNVLIDPLMALNLTPVHGGLVILLGDDPGGYGSQNDQDTRSLAPFLEMPMFEPSTPAEGFQMLRDAFDLSERFQTPVIVRETRSFSVATGKVDIPEGPHEQPDRGFAREPGRFVPVPRNVVAKHRALHDRLAKFAAWAEGESYLKTSGTGDLGVIAPGFAASKLGNVLGPEPPHGLRVGRLGLLHPLPVEALGRFLADCREVMVIEETEPFLERALRAIAHEHAPRTRILGKGSGHLRPEGELFRWQITEALRAWQPDLPLARAYSSEDEDQERPKKESFCAGCRYDEVVRTLDEVAGAEGGRPIIVADPGCLVTLAERLDAKYAIGSAIGVAHGLALGGVTDRVTAIFGDSAFFHSALPALCDAVVARSPILMIVLDNQSTRTSGNQPHPGVGRDALGRPAPKLSMERIARACDVEFVRTVPLGVPPTGLRQALQDAWKYPTPALIVVEIPPG